MALPAMSDSAASSDLIVVVLWVGAVRPHGYKKKQIRSRQKHCVVAGNLGECHKRSKCRLTSHSGNPNYQKKQIYLTLAYMGTTCDTGNRTYVSWRGAWGGRGPKREGLEPFVAKYRF